MVDGKKGPSKIGEQHESPMDTSTSDVAKFENMSAMEHIGAACASIKANAGPQGLTPQEQRAVAKLHTAEVLLTGNKETSRRGRVK